VSHFGGQRSGWPPCVDGGQSTGRHVRPRRISGFSLKELLQAS
jgi:hypothetical protein